MGDTEYMWIGYDEVLFSTIKATQFELGEEEPQWIPKSVINDIDTEKHNVEVAEWWLIKEGLV